MLSTQTPHSKTLTHIFFSNKDKPLQLKPLFLHGGSSNACKIMISNNQETWEIWRG